MNTKTVELVIEKSRLPIKIGIMRLIENCSNGEKNITNINNKKSKNR